MSYPDFGNKIPADQWQAWLEAKRGQELANAALDCGVPERGNAGATNE